MGHTIKFATLVFVGLYGALIFMGFSSPADAQTAEELKRYNEINNNIGKGADDIMRAINGPPKDPNLGVYSKQEQMQLLFDALKVKKNDGGASRQQFLDNFNRQNAQKQREVEAAEAYKQDWIRQERARQQAERDIGVARERAARAAREDQRRQDAARAERISREHNAAMRAKNEAEKKRRAERYAAAQRRKNAPASVSISSGPSGKYADDGLDDLPPPLIVVTPEEPPKKKAKPETCPCKPGWQLGQYQAYCEIRSDLATIDTLDQTMKPGEWPMHKACYAHWWDSMGECGWAKRHDGIPVPDSCPK